jgi:hypothetical protein
MIEEKNPHVSVTYLNLACSGAGIMNGVIGPYEGTQKAYSSAYNVPLTPSTDKDCPNCLPPQVNEVARLLCPVINYDPSSGKCPEGGRKIDALTVSIGANDVGFSSAAMSCAILPNCGSMPLWLLNPLCPLGLSLLQPWLYLLCAAAFLTWEGYLLFNHMPLDTSQAEVLTGVKEKLDNLPHLYALLDADLRAKLDVSTVYIQEYPDPTHNSDGSFGLVLDEVPTLKNYLINLIVGIVGIVGAWPPGLSWAVTTLLTSPLGQYIIPGLDGVTPDESQWAYENVVLPLNGAISEAAQAHKWRFVSGIAARFLPHGYAAQDHWFNTLTESLVRQSDYLGSIHPNMKGLQSMANLLYAHITDQPPYFTASRGTFSWDFLCILSLFQGCVSDAEGTNGYLVGVCDHSNAIDCLPNNAQRVAWLTVFAQGNGIRGQDCVLSLFPSLRCSSGHPHVSMNGQQLLYYQMTDPANNPDLVDGGLLNPKASNSVIDCSPTDPVFLGLILCNYVPFGASGGPLWVFEFKASVPLAKLSFDVADYLGVGTSFEYDAKVSFDNPAASAAILNSPVPTVLTSAWPCGSGFTLPGHTIAPCPPTSYSSEVTVQLFGNQTSHGPPIDHIQFVWDPTVDPRQGIGSQDKYSTVSPDFNDITTSCVHPDMQHPSSPTCSAALNSTDGVHTLWYQAVDLSGRRGPWSSLSVTVDSTLFNRSVTGTQTGTEISCNTPIVRGTSSKCTATVTSSSTGPAATGTVNFPNYGSCTLGIAAGASANCSIKIVPPFGGFFSIVGNYTGDSAHETSIGSTLLTVNQRDTSMTILCVPLVVKVGVPTTCNAMVRDMSPLENIRDARITIPTGGLTFVPGGDCKLELIIRPAPGSHFITGYGCNVTVTPDAAGAMTISVSYGGDYAHAGSNASDFVRVDKRDTSLSLGCGPESVVTGQTTNCTATVTDSSEGNASTPKGSVAFTPGGACDLAGTGASSSCSVSIAPAKAETVSVSANFEGDLIHSRSSNNLDLTVNKHQTTTSIRCDPSPAILANPATCKVTVTDGSVVPSAPSGAVTVARSDASGTFTSLPCTLSGMETSTSCRVSYTPVSSTSGTNLITAFYSGDPDHTSSNGTLTLPYQSQSQSPVLQKIFGLSPLMLYGVTGAALAISIILGVLAFVRTKKRGGPQRPTAG